MEGGGTYARQLFWISGNGELGRPGSWEKSLSILKAAACIWKVTGGQFRHGSLHHAHPLAAVKRVAAISHVLFVCCIEARNCGLQGNSCWSTSAFPSVFTRLRSTCGVRRPSSASTDGVQVVSESPCLLCWVRALDGEATPGAAIPQGLPHTERNCRKRRLSARAVSAISLRELGSEAIVPKIRG